jgi:hypothetical protein
MVDRTDLETYSPLASLRDAGVSGLVSEGPVRFLLVSGTLDGGSWGVIGAFWLSIDGERGGFAVSPEAVWQGSEMSRNYRSAERRGWPAEMTYRYWQHQVGVASPSLMVDPQQHADTLLAVYRRVGAL